MTTKLQKEKRARYLENLIKESIINVLAEQEMPVQPTQPASAAPPQSVQPSPETNAAESTQQVQQDEPQEFTVELMVDKLNVIRGSKSFSDPEVFGRLTTFFNNLTSEQKVSFNYLLTELGNTVLGATEEEAGLNANEQAPQQQSGISQQSPPPPPPAGGNSSSESI